MIIREISLINFRNYQKLNLRIDCLVNVFYGNNAQGKTNLLEGIFYSAFGMSHRTRNEDDLIKMSCPDMAAEVTFDNYYGEHKLKIKRKSIDSKLKKEISLDENIIKPKEHYGTLNVVMFSPEDLQIVKGEPSLRRRFLDMEIAQTNRYYYSLLVKYNRVVQQRNKLLKDGRERVLDLSILEVWDNELAVLAAQILSIRLKVLEKINTIAGNIYKEITNQREELVINYELKANSSTIICSKEESTENWKDWYLNKLAERQKIDILRGSTGIGPHRDDLLIMVNEKNLRSFGSQGQQRSVALALKLAEMEYVKEEAGEYPILLLDDVMSELDSERRNQILNFIDGRLQTFITVNDKNLIPKLDCNKYFYVTEGSIREG